MKLIIKMLTVWLALALFITFGVKSTQVDAAKGVSLAKKSGVYYVATGVDGKVYGSHCYVGLKEVDYIYTYISKVKLNYSSKNKKVAKVNKRGVVTAVGAGKTKIVVKATYKKGKKKYTQKLNYTVTVKKVTLASSDAHALDAIITDQNSRDAKLSRNPFEYCTWASVSDNSEGWRIEKLMMDEKGMTGDLSLKDLNNLEEAVVSRNDLKSLDVGGLKSLKSLYCDENKMIQLNVSGCIALEELWCGINVDEEDDYIGNYLTSLDVSTCSSLKDLYCSNNNLTSLDVTRNTKLEALHIDNNNIKYIDVSNCKELYDFEHDDGVKVVGWDEDDDW